MHPPILRRALAIQKPATALGLVLSTILFGACGSDDSPEPIPVAAGGSSGSGTGGASTGGASTGGSAGSGNAGQGGQSTGGAAPTGGAGGSPPAVDYCQTCAEPQAAGTLSNGEIGEASGVMPSHTHSGLLFLHNDSGDSARFFAIDLQGSDLGTFNVSGASARDWEDAASGPCPDGRCLFFGDVGDNPENRSSYAIYQVSEPTDVGPGSYTVPGIELPFTYPDGSHNCETLLVHPVTGEMVVVTKVSGSGLAGIYRFPMPLTPGQTATLDHVGSVEPIVGTSPFTGGDVHPHGHGILLRTYSNVFFYEMGPGMDIAEALAGSPCIVPSASESQGEAVAWTADGTGYVTISEGVGSSVHLSSCEELP